MQPLWQALQSRPRQNEIQGDPNPVHRLPTAVKIEKPETDQGPAPSQRKSIPSPADARSIVHRDSDQFNNVDIQHPKGYNSLRTKMMALFCFIPIMVLFISGILYLRQLNHLAELLNRDSSNIVKRLAENNVKERARSVSTQFKLLLLNSADVSPETLSQDEEIVRTVKQKVGLTGYTALYENPGNGEPINLLIHPDDALNGKSLAAVMRQRLGKGFERFDKILIEARKGNQIESAGYYRQAGRHKLVREKYMVLSPVLGTNCGIMAVTHLDELTREISRLSQRANRIISATHNIVFIILASSLVLISLVVLAYGQSLAGRVQSLTEMAE
jgi:signal transduction histidine kinase